jgi:hypothetical protein
MRVPPAWMNMIARSDRCIHDSGRMVSIETGSILKCEMRKEFRRFLKYPYNK